MDFSIGKKITAGFSVALLVLVIIAVVSSLDLAELNSDSFWVTHTVEAQRRLDSLMSGLLQAESSARGYRLLPDPSFQMLFNQGKTEVVNDFKTLRTLVQDNPNQVHRLDQLDPLIHSRLDSLQKIIDLAPTATSMEVQQETLVQSGLRNMDDIRRLISDMEGEEQHLLQKRQAGAAHIAQITSGTIIYGSLGALVLVSISGLLVVRSITRPLHVLGEGAARIGDGNYGHRVAITSKDEVGELASLFNQMAAQVQQRQTSLENEDWVKTSLAKFTTFFQGQRDARLVCQSILSELATLLDIRHSLFYVPQRTADGLGLKLQASYAFDAARDQLQIGEGLVGQCFVEKKRIELHEIPANYLKITSGLGEISPAHILVQPILFENEVKAVMELAFIHPMTPNQIAFLDQLVRSIGVVLTTIEANTRTEELLKRSQMLSENLQARQNELSVKNERLEAQAAQLRDSELLLQEQQEELKQTNEEMEQANEELQQTNEEMEEKVHLLAEQKKEMERTNREIQSAREALEEKAEEIARTSKYKSEFLANMSHELRTPLNSLLILAKMLSDNPDNNLTPKQRQYAQTIHSSGNDLLELINEVLDLSRIESGSVELEPDELVFSELAEFVQNSFQPLAESKKLELQINFAASLPPTIKTDPRRLHQVLKNLLSNAFKFTETGSVTLTAAPASAGWDRSIKSLNRAPGVIAFAVTDTGIGIPADKQQLIFEAFQQADAGTARKYGGTGLGLSISREIAGLLGGSLHVKSDMEKGSTFTLYLPTTLPETPAATTPQRKPPREGRSPRTEAPAANAGVPLFSEDASSEAIEDDRANLQAGDLILLIIEDDRNFARILIDFAREKNFKAVVARSVAQGVAMANQIHPSAITLDLHLPDNDGWVVLDRLKHDPATRHIPIHIISVDEERERSLRLGAVSYLQKPVTKELLDNALTQTIEFINRPLKNLLIIEDDAVQRESMADLIGNGDVHTTAVGSAAEAFAALEKERYDCIVLDLGLPDVQGPQLIRQIQEKYGQNAPPIIVYTGKELNRQEETELRLISDSIVIKNARSPERLLDETALFLHRVQTKLPEPKRRMIELAHKNDSILARRKILVVDDDVRNIFAITSALEASQMEVSYAENGQASIDYLQDHPEVEAVLMDVMMPGMDGFETIRRIRRIDRFKKLPIISVTAKAMKGDREKCLEAGASDYITKPVDMDQLRSLLRVWLYK